MTSAEPKTKKRFPRLSSAAFEHPADRAALEAVKKIPLLDKVFAKLLELGIERVYRIMLMGNTVHVTPKQCPKIYKLFREACDILDMAEPDLFITNNPFPNAMTLGFERPVIILHSSIVDLLTEDELQAVLGHELGHVKAGHTLYKTIAYFLLEIMRMIFGTSQVAEMALAIALWDWSRKSELTADRAEALVAQDLDTCIRLHMKLSCGSWSIYHDMDSNEFLKQADNYEEFDYSTLNKVYKLLQELPRSHPLPVYRAKETKAWMESRQYKEILEGRYPTKDEEIGLRDCPHCGCKVSPSFFFCPDCGKSARV